MHGGNCQCCDAILPIRVTESISAVQHAVRVRTSPCRSVLVAPHTGAGQRCAMRDRGRAGLLFVLSAPALFSTVRCCTMDTAVRASYGVRLNLDADENLNALEISVRWARFGAWRSLALTSWCHYGHGLGAPITQHCQRAFRSRSYRHGAHGRATSMDHSSRRLGSACSGAGQRTGVWLIHRFRRHTKSGIETKKLREVQKRSWIRA